MFNQELFNKICMGTCTFEELEKDFSLNLRDARFLLLTNAYSPTVSTPPHVIDVNPVAPLNALFPILLMRG